jgi:hypothetical protein
MMKKNNVFCTWILSTVWIMTCNIAIAEAPRSKTTWSIVGKSLTELLDSGWTIIGHSSYRVVIAPYTNGAVDEATHSFILHKNGKYIDCLIKNPSPGNAYSACRQLN